MQYEWGQLEEREEEREVSVFLFILRSLTPTLYAKGYLGCQLVNYAWALGDFVSEERQVCNASVSHLKYILEQYQRVSCKIITFCISEWGHIVSP